MAVRHKKGLYFDCDEKFNHGQKCSAKFFLLISNEKDDAQGEPNLTDLQPKFPIATDSSQTQISFHAFSGHLAPKIVRLLGRISNQKVAILIDGGNTHNFVQEHMVIGPQHAAHKPIQGHGGQWKRDWVLPPLWGCGSTCTGPNLHRGPPCSATMRGGPGIGHPMTKIPWSHPHRIQLSNDEVHVFWQSDRIQGRQWH